MDGGSAGQARPDGVITLVFPHSEEITNYLIGQDERMRLLRLYPGQPFEVNKRLKPGGGLLTPSQQLGLAAQSRGWMHPTTRLDSTHGVDIAGLTRRLKLARETCSRCLEVSIMPGDSPAAHLLSIKCQGFPFCGNCAWDGYADSCDLYAPVSPVPQLVETILE